MFRRHSIDITDILHPDDQNLLAVPVYPPDHPGRIPPHGGQDRETCCCTICRRLGLDDSNKVRTELLFLC
ncbi:hypothetical protein P3L10_022282 [Capsicum annuum]